MKKIMIFIGSYLPGTKSAGVTTSINNMVKALETNYEFYIVTADHDIGEIEKYSDVPLEQWTKYGSANVFYSGKYLNSLRDFMDIVNSVNVDAYYFNGFYNIQDTAKGLFLWKLGKITRKPIIIAPRGIFNMGEFKKNEIMRRMYRLVFKIARFTNNVYWHATAQIEKDAILKYFPTVAEKIFVVGNLSGLTIKPLELKLDKEVGNLKIVFISRISKKKNIKLIVETLQKIKGTNIECDIYGMIGTEDDKMYWDSCQELARNLPANIHFNYKGEVSHDKVPEIFRTHHLFFFPTFGENYGHVIAESLAYGCPVLLSDTTPWNILPEYNAGWVHSLSDATLFEIELQKIIDMNLDEWREYSIGACNAAKELIDSDKIAGDHLNMFNAAIWK